MAEDISSKVKKIVADHLGIDEAKVTDEASFIDDLDQKFQIVRLKKFLQ